MLYYTYYVSICYDNMRTRACVDMTRCTGMCDRDAKMTTLSTTITTTNNNNNNSNNSNNNRNDYPKYDDEVFQVISVP